MIVDQARDHDLAGLKAEHHAPVAGDANAPLPDARALPRGCSRNRMRRSRVRDRQAAARRRRAWAAHAVPCALILMIHCRALRHTPQASALPSRPAAPLWGCNHHTKGELYISRLEIYSILYILRLEIYNTLYFPWISANRPRVAGWPRVLPTGPPAATDRANPASPTSHRGTPAMPGRGSGVRIARLFGGSSSGRTADSDSASGGSNPSPPATETRRAHDGARPATHSQKPKE